MCYTWLQAAAVLGFDVRVSAPPGYADRSGPRRRGRRRAHFAAFADPREACRGADLVTTDVWTSMGFEAENDDAQARVRVAGASTPR